MNLIVFKAMLAQTTQPNPQGSMLMIGGYLVFFVIIFYFMAIRPQSKKAKEQATMLKSLRPGDKIITTSGIVGTVVSVKEKTAAIRSADTKLEVLKSAISDITERGGESSASES
ncbi:MAG: protein translocase subunit yajC [Pedosphaera sp.]|nr:protein translocase subunit yajC [Pedosphaera sp.]